MAKEEKKSRKYNARTPKEIAMAKADKSVRDMDRAVKQIQDLRTRINALPSGEFSEMALAYNGYLETLPDLSALAFVQTEKPDEPEIKVSESKSFLDFTKSESE